LNTRQVEALAKACRQDRRNASVGAGMSPAPSVMDPNLARLETELAERLGTRVTIDCGADGQGRLIIDFADLEILEGVLARLGYEP
jgi:ParB family chromosome partitioning protein